MNSTLANLSVTQLQQAIVIKEKIEALEKNLAAIFGTPVTTTAPGAARKPKRTMSAAGRQRIAAAALARWAKLRAAKSGVAGEVPKKRRLSAAGRARIIAATKARWARLKATAGAPPAKVVKRKFSPEARARMAAAAKARWAKAKATQAAA
jgi:hypothetical protein